MRGWIGAAIVLTATLAGAVRAGAQDFASFQRLVIGGNAVRWLPPEGNRPLVISYAVAGGEIADPRAINCRSIRSPDSLLQRSALSREAFDRTLRRAFDRWQRAADVTFVEAAPGTRAQIVIGEQVEPEGFAFTNLTLGSQSGGDPTAILSASICLNPQRAWKVGFDGNLAVYDLEHTLAHEIGHAIGLDHPGARGHLMSFMYAETAPDLTAGDATGAMSIYGPARGRGVAASDVTSSKPVSSISTGSITPLSRGLESPAAR
jgi:hypothetical protein